MLDEATSAAVALARALTERFGPIAVWTEDGGAPPPEPYLRVAPRGGIDDHYSGRTSWFHVDSCGLPFAFHLEMTHHELSGTCDAWCATVRGAAENDRAFLAGVLDPHKAWLGGVALGQYSRVDVKVE